MYKHTMKKVVIDLFKATCLSKYLYMYPHEQIYMLQYMYVQTVCGNMSF